MSLYELKPRFQALLRPYAERLANAGVSPNQITLAALALAALTGLLVALFPESRAALLVLSLAFAVRMALNAIDGMIAREHGRATPGGRLLNELADVAADMAMLLPLMLVPEFSPFLVCLAVIAAVATEVAGLAAVSIGASRRHDGPMGKSDRAAVFGGLALLDGVGLLPAVIGNLALALVIGLAFLTVMNRVNAALEEAAAVPAKSPAASKPGPPPSS